MPPIDLLCANNFYRGYEILFIAEWPGKDSVLTCCNAFIKVR